MRYAQTSVPLVAEPSHHLDSFFPPKMWNDYLFSQYLLLLTFLVIAVLSGMKDCLIVMSIFWWLVKLNTVTCTNCHLWPSLEICIFRFITVPIFGYFFFTIQLFEYIVFQIKAPDIACVSQELSPLICCIFILLFSLQNVFFYVILVI